MQFARAEQHTKLPKVGVLWPWPANANSYHQALEKGLRSLGWIDGQTVRLVVRYNASGDSAQLRDLVAELIAQKIDLLVVSGGASAVHIARKATTTIPIVCPDFYDPIAEGVTSSLARPPGNVTGTSFLAIESASKRVELTKELVPNLKRMALLFEAGDVGAELEVKAVLESAQSIGVTVQRFAVSDLKGIERAFREARKRRAQAMIVSYNPITEIHRREIVRYAQTFKLALIGEGRTFAEAGFLLTYGADMPLAFERAATHVDKILKGAKPQDIPFEQPTRFQLFLNHRAAKAHGLSIPESILLRLTNDIR